MPTGLRQSTTWRDVKGNTATVKFFVSGSGTIAGQAAASAAVITAMEALTNCAWQGASGPATKEAGPVVYGTAAQFVTVEDKAIFTFSCADGTLHRYKIPAPKVSLFEVDEETIDASQTDVAAFVTAALANITNASDLALSAFVGGTRARVKMRRKLNIYVLVPELDEPAE